ncbi:MAG: hypothetical protein ACLQVD_20765 [Capsulimonadaceae bacterium]
MTDSALPDRIDRLIRAPWFLPVAVGVLALLILGRYVVGPANVILSARSTDLSMEFVYWRQFGFEQLRHGHLALWNPYVFSGTPFMGGWQAALLYPPDWTYLLLPLGRAINLELALHVYIAGLGMALWARYHGMHPVSALLAGCMTMFGGPFFLHVYAGHLATIDTMAWIPYVLLAADGLIDVGKPATSSPAVDAAESRGDAGRKYLKWGLLACFTLAMQVLAGHPQTLFNTIITLVLYVAIRLVQRLSAWPAALVLAAAGIGAVAITAVQIVTGLAAASEGTRQGAVPFAFASMFGLPPENLTTVVAPFFFGSLNGVHYWGRCYLWEVCVFVGIAGITLAVLGFMSGSWRIGGIEKASADAHGRKKGTRHPAPKPAVGETGAPYRSLCIPWGIMAFLLLWIALGAHTPLFRLLYDAVPGFNKFRAHAKFIFEASLFLSIGAGAGLDTLLAGQKQRAYAIATGIFGLLSAATGICLLLASKSDSSWSSLVSFITSNDDTPRNSLDTANSILESGAGAGLLVAGATAVVLAVIVAASVKRRSLVPCVAVVGILELLVFAGSSLATFHLSDTILPPIQQQVASDPGDYRLLQANVPMDDESIVLGRSDIWGYDPTVLARYAQYMYYSQGQNPDDADMYLSFSHGSPLMDLFRLKYAYSLHDDRLSLADTEKTWLPRAFLAASVVTQASRDQILSALDTKTVDFTKTVYVEPPGVTPPDPGSTSGTITVHDAYPGCMIVKATVPSLAVAVFTEPYSRGWQAQAMPGSSQRTYQVVPADWAAMAVPLNPGTHIFRLIYIPHGFIAGAWVSGISTAVFLILAVVASIPRRRRASVE